MDVSAIDVSSVVGLVAIGMLTAQILLGLLLSVGYNPQREWPRWHVKLFTVHNWLGYITIATALVHPTILLVSSTAGFRLFDIFVPIWSPTQPVPNTLGAIAFYLLAFVVLTSYFRRLFGRHRWKQLHYAAYALAVVAYVHGVLADPLLKNRPIDFVDAEKVYVEGCALAKGRTRRVVTALIACPAAHQFAVTAGAQTTSSPAPQPQVPVVREKTTDGAEGGTRARKPRRATPKVERLRTS